MRAPYTIVTTPHVKKSIDRPQDFIELAKIIWHRFTPLTAFSIDAFIQFDFMLGLPKLRYGKTYLIGYDVIPLIFRDDYLPTPWQAWKKEQTLFKKAKKATRALYYQWRYAFHYQNFKRADRILAISYSTKESLHKLLAIPQEKVLVIPLAPVFSTNTSEQPKNLTTLESPFIFYIGATDNRKRVQDLVAAFNKVRASGHKLTLVLAGKELNSVKKIPNIPIREAITSSPYVNDILTTGYVNDSGKLWLYENASAFVFPTVYEGFGLPILESMKVGCPFISYENSSIPEVAGQAGLLVKTGDIDALAKSIESIITDSDLAAELSSLGRSQSEKFTWEHYVNDLLGAILEDT